MLWLKLILNKHTNRWKSWGNGQGNYRYHAAIGRQTDYFTFWDRPKSMTGIKQFENIKRCKTGVFYTQSKAANILATGITVRIAELF